MTWFVTFKLGFIQSHLYQTTRHLTLYYVCRSVRTQAAL